VSAHDRDGWLKTCAGGAGAWLGLLLILAQPAHAEVTKVSMATRVSVAGGQP